MKLALTLTTRVVHSIRFQTFFFLYRHFKLFWTLENSVCYCYTSYEMTDKFLWFRVEINSYSKNWNTTLLKPDCHSWWISKMQSGREDTLEERYAIKFCFKLGKMPQKRVECFRHLAWIEHQFLSGIRDSRKAGSLWGMMRGVGGKEVITPELIGQRVCVTMLRF